MDSTWVVSAWVVRASRQSPRSGKDRYEGPDFRASSLEHKLVAPGRVLSGHIDLRAHRLVLVTISTVPPCVWEQMSTFSI